MQPREIVRRAHQARRVLNRLVENGGAPETYDEEIKELAQLAMMAPAALKPGLTASIQKFLALRPS